MTMQRTVATAAASLQDAMDDVGTAEQQHHPDNEFLPIHHSHRPPIKRTA